MGFAGGIRDDVPVPKFSISHISTVGFARKVVFAQALGSGMRACLGGPLFYCPHRAPGVVALRLSLCSVESLTGASW